MDKRNYYSNRYTTKKGVDQLANQFDRDFLPYFGETGKELTFTWMRIDQIQVLDSSKYILITSAISGLDTVAGIVVGNDIQNRLAIKATYFNRGDEPDTAQLVINHLRRNSMDWGIEGAIVRKVLSDKHEPNAYTCELACGTLREIFSGDIPQSAEDLFVGISMLGHSNDDFIGGIREYLLTMPR